MEDFIHMVKGLFVLDTEGQRIFSKYFTDRKTLAASAELSTASAALSTAPTAHHHRGVNGAHGKFTMLDTVEQQLKFEKHVFGKTSKQAARINLGEVDIAEVEGYNVLFMTERDLVFYVFGTERNEQILAEVTQCIVDALNRLFDGQMEKRTLMENFSFLLLTVDEVLDDGVIMEIDANAVAERVQNVESAPQAITIAGEQVNLGEEGNAIASKLLKTAQGLFSF